MTTIGVYDSGIGGLTTLAKLLARFEGYNFYYYADNANMPFGTKSSFEIYKTVKEGVKRVADNSDYQVIACNTASTVVRPKSAFLLHPDLSGLRPEKTLVLATPATLDILRANENFFNTANTKELATLIEISASLSFKRRGTPNFDTLNGYIAHKLEKIPTVNTVILGCSHYIYIKRLIELSFPNATIKDGNDTLIKEMSALLPKKEKTNQKVNFDFSGGSEKEKYVWLLEQLCAEQVQS